MRATSLLRAVPRLTLYSGQNCSLCETAKETIMELRQKRDVEFKFQDIDIRSDDFGYKHWKLKALYQYDIPVLDLNGKVVMKHRIDLDELERLVREASEQPEQQAGPGDKPASEDT